MSPHTQATVRQITGEPYVSFRQIWNRTDAAAKGLKFPNYNGPLRDLVIADGGGRKAIFSVIDEHIDVPYTIQTMVSVQRAHRAARSRWNRVHPHQRPGFPAAAAVCAGARPGDRS